MEHAGFKGESGQGMLPNRGPTIWKDFGLNPIHMIAKDRPVFSLWVMPWTDDVSGNQSKQYNLHVNIYMKNLNVPSNKLK